MADYETNYSVVNRVLVVEDDAAERDRLRKLLSGDGLDVETAKDGGQARSAINMNKPDLILLDLILPNESGFEVCEWIKLTKILRIWTFKFQKPCSRKTSTF